MDAVPQRAEPGRLSQHLPRAYDEMRAMARQLVGRWQAGRGIRPTSLVHETYVRLSRRPGASYNDREHFLAVSAKAMRCVLVDAARRRGALRRGAGRRDQPLSDSLVAAPSRPDTDVLALDAALDELEDFDGRKARVVELRFFGGLGVEETAEVLGVSSATVKREWRTARAWLHRRVRGASGSSS